MKLKMLKALWGMEGRLEDQFERIAAAGYSGIETAAPSPENEERFRRLLEAYKFDYIAMVFTSGDHIATFRRDVERAATFRPLLINAHSAKDDMPYESQLAFYREAVAIEKQVGIAIGHETHRGRALFTPWTTERLLKDVPELKLTADFSHWCCVCESLLENQGERLSLAASRTLHVHSRVGYSQGPQVTDPAAPENADALRAHTEWWRSIARSRRDQGAETMTIVPEFGPPGYMHTLPYTNKPVSDLWDVCLWMKGYIEERFDSWLA